jgi:hypothetical protein
MGFDFKIFNDSELKEEFVNWLVDEKWVDINSHFGRLWEYYQNSMLETGVQLNESSRTYVQAQEYGLPARITGFMRSQAAGMFGGQRLADVQRKEVVIENDITWRINALVDFLFGKNVNFISKSPDEAKRREIEQIINAVFSANGGIGFFQDMAVLGSVYGFVDCLVRPGRTLLERMSLTSISTSDKHSFDSIVSFASQISLELIEAARALPVLDENDYRSIKYYIQNFYQQKNDVIREGSFLNRILNSKGSATNRKRTIVTEILGPTAWQRYENQELIDEGENPMGRVPVVHIQNIAQPYFYEGASDVEQLIPLQDELNTRLSDRANRVTFQSFKMYLAKGIEGFEDRPVSPGRMWSTDNPDASIEQFGGDGATPSEDNHIAEIRDAMDKTSCVSPVVAGVLKDRLGNLTSAVALKLTLMGMLAKNERKKFTYGHGVQNIIEMIFDVLDKAGVYKTTPQERMVDIVFANPLPDTENDSLQNAKLKLELGVPQEQVFKELGY